MKKIILIIFLVCSFFASAFSESRLDSFERKATSKKSSKNVKRISSSGSSSSSSHGSFLGELFVDILKSLFSTSRSSRVSAERVGEGSPMLSFGEEPSKGGVFKLSHYYQHVEKNIFSLQSSMYVGYRSIGFKVSYIKYHEKNPFDQLEQIHLHLLYRAVVSETFDWDLGLGEVIFKGNSRHESFSLFNRLYIKFPSGKSRFGLKLLSTFYWLNGNSLNKNDLSLCFLTEHLSLEAGHQWHYSKNTSFELSGPFIGLSLYF